MIVYKTFFDSKTRIDEVEVQPQEDDYILIERCKGVFIRAKLNPKYKGNNCFFSTKEEAESFNLKRQKNGINRD